MTHRGVLPPGDSRLLQAIYRRASMVICQDDSEVAMLRHWLPGLAVGIIPDIEHRGSADNYLRAYQNSQRTPIAGSNGVQ